jgi:type IV pilus assembly protein PilV
MLLTPAPLPPLDLELDLGCATTPKLTPTQQRRLGPQAGTSLIEVLVSLMILVFSLLGVAAVQLKLSQYTQSAVARSQSSNVVTDIIEKMRANRSAALEGAYNAEFASTAAACAPANLLVRYGSQSGTNNANSSAGLAAAELVQLRNELACLLPAGDIRIAAGSVATPNNTNCSATLAAANNDNVVTLIVRYDDRKAEKTTAPTANATGTANVAGSAANGAVWRCFTEVVQL